MGHFLLLGVLLLLLSPLSCQAAPKAPPVVSVDMRALMAESAPGRQGAAHLEKVREVLQKGFEELKAAHKDSSPEERQKALAEGLAALNRQMELERGAVERIVSGLAVEEIAKWRKANGVMLVIPRSVVIDGDMNAADFTRTILAALNKRSAAFPDLPVVSVKKPGEGTAGAAAK